MRTPSHQRCLESPGWPKGGGGGDRDESARAIVFPTIPSTLVTRILSIVVETTLLFHLAISHDYYYIQITFVL